MDSLLVPTSELEASHSTVEQKASRPLVATVMGLLQHKQSKPSDAHNARRVPTSKHRTNMEHV